MTTTTTLRSCWRRERALKVPAVRQSAVDERTRHAVASTPFSNGCRLSIYTEGLAAIQSLFSRSCPSNVTGFIVSVAVRPSIDRMVRRWSWTNVREEVLKAFTPAITNCHAAPAVTLKRLLAWKAAAIQHAAPDNVLSRLRSAVFQASLGSRGSTQTTTRPRPPRHEGSAINVLGPSARAQINPSIDAWRRPRHCPATKREPGQVSFRLAHVSLFSVLSVSLSKGILYG